MGNTFQLARTFDPTDINTVNWSTYIWWTNLIWRVLGLNVTTTVHIFEHHDVVQIRIIPWGFWYTTGFLRKVHQEGVKSDRQLQGTVEFENKRNGSSKIEENSKNATVTKYNNSQTWDFT